MADDRMRLPTAYFHDGPTARRDRLDLVDQAAREFWIAEFV
jgi:hypothetical protein